jgi:hypothetical protein
MPNTNSAFSSIIASVLSSSSPAAGSAEAAVASVISANATTQAPSGTALENLNQWEQACYKAVSRYRNWLTHNMILFLTDFLNSDKGNGDIKEISGGLVDHMAEHALGNLAAHGVVHIAADTGGHMIVKLFLEKGTAAVLGGVAGFVIDVVIESTIGGFFEKIKTTQLVGYTAGQIDALVTGVVNPIADEKQQQILKTMQDLRTDLIKDPPSAEQWTDIRMGAAIASFELSGVLPNEKDERLYRLMALIDDVYGRESVPAEQDPPIVPPTGEHVITFTMQHTEVKTGQTSIDVPEDNGTLLVLFRGYDGFNDDGEFGEVDIESPAAPAAWTRPRPPRDYNVLLYLTGSAFDTTIGVPRVYRVGFQEYGVWFNLAKGVYHLTIQRGDDHIVALCGEGKYWVKTGL